MSFARIRFCAGLALFGVAAAIVLVEAPQASAAVVVVRPFVRVAPPPVRVEPVPAARPGWVWTGGYWRWSGRRYVWVPGAWVGARPGYVYRPARWAAAGGGWVFVPAGWVYRP
jgi:hypothetical protein